MFFEKFELESSKCNHNRKIHVLQYIVNPGSFARSEIVAESQEASGGMDSRKGRTGCMEAGNNEHLTEISDDDAERV